MAQVIQHFSPSRKQIKAGDVFIYKLSDGREFYGLVAKTKFTLGGFKNCLLLYFFDVSTTAEPDFKNLSVKKYDLLFAPTLSGNDCWKEGYFSTIGNIDLGDTIFETHYFKFPQGIRDEEMNKIEHPNPKIPISDAAYPSGLTLLDDIEDCFD